MKLRSFVALVVLVAVPFVPALAQPQPAAPPSVSLTTLRATIQSIGYRNADRNRQVFVTMRVTGVSGQSPNAPVLRTGTVVRLAYACSLDASSPRTCTSARNHPPGLGAIGPTVLSLIGTEARVDEVPVPDTRSPSQGQTLVSTQGQTFRQVTNAITSAIVLEVYNGDPGPLTTSPGPMVAR